MKKISIIIVVCMAAGLFVACQSPVTTTDGGTTTTLALTATTTTVPAVVQRSIKVNDANDVFLGYCVSANATRVSIYTNNDFIVDLNWDGSLQPADLVYFTLADAGGIPFLPSFYRPSATLLLVGGNSVLYKIKNVTDGLGVETPSITGSLSYVRYTGSTVNNVGTNSNPAYELEPTTRAAVGLPATIASPLQLTFE